MIEYTAQCRLSSYDAMRANIDTGDVEIAALKDDEQQMEVYLRPEAARTFARGILALADKIDGGEAKEEPTPALKVGDRVRIVRNSPTDGATHVGEVGELKAVDEHDDRLPYRVSISGDDYGWWCAEVELADEPAPAPAPEIKVGDTVRVVKDDPTIRTGEFVGKIGTVLQVGGSARQALNFRLEFPNGKAWWVNSVELVDVLAPADEPAPHPFAAHVDEAKRLLTGTDHTGADVIRLAEILTVGK